MSTKKPKKKYNPNKLAQIQAAKNAVIKAKMAVMNEKWKEFDVLYEFNMEFAIEKVNKIVGDYADAHNLGDDDYVPAHVTVGAYECQDLIIAMKKQMIKTPEFWEVGIDSHFYNAELHDVITVPFSLNIPSMSHAELMGGKEVRVHLVDGDLKNVLGDWQGLQPEMIANWERHGIPDGYELIQSQVSITAYAHFKDYENYDNFHYLLKRRDEGDLLRYLAFEEQVGGIVDTTYRKHLGAA